MKKKKEYKKFIRVHNYENNKSKLARDLNVSRTTIYNWIKKSDMVTFYALINMLKAPKEFCSELSKWFKDMKKNNIQF